MRNKIIFIGLALTLFIISLAAGLRAPAWIKERKAQQEKAAFVTGAVPKRQLQDFAAQFANVDAATEPKYLPGTPFAKTSGGTARIADFYGKPMLVNIWATWCLPCVVELPSLQNFHDAYAGRIQVVAIATDPGKTAGDIAKFLQGRRLGPFAGYLDADGSFVKELGLSGVPTSFLIGSNGQILYRFEGDAEWDSPAAAAFFDVFLLQNR